MLAGTCTYIQLCTVHKTCILIVGMLSKAKGQILRVAACIHVLFSDFKDNEDEDIIPTIRKISPEISEDAIIAAQNFVETCCQHCMFLCGKGILDNEIKRHGEGTYVCLHIELMLNYKTADFDDSLINNAAYTLLQPGRILDLSTMLKNKKYQNRGNKEGAVKVMKKLEEDGLGTLKKKELNRGAAAVSHLFKAYFCVCLPAYLLSLSGTSSLHCIFMITPNC